MKGYVTKLNIPEDVRITVVKELNPIVANLIDLKYQVKSAHWNTIGREYIGLHELYDRIQDRVEESVDSFAEQIVSMKFFVRGTIREVIGMSQLKPFPGTEDKITTNNPEENKKLSEINKDEFKNLLVSLLNKNINTEDLNNNEKAPETVQEKESEPIENQNTPEQEEEIDFIVLYLIAIAEAISVCLDSIMNSSKVLKMIEPVTDNELMGLANYLRKELMFIENHLLPSLPKTQ